MELREKIITNTGNSAVLKFLEKRSSPIVAGSTRLFTWDEINETNATIRFHEGLCIFMEKLAKLIPETAKYYLNNHGILVNEENGLIFAFHFDRYAPAFRCDLERTGISNADELRYFTDWEDIRELHENWALLLKFAEEEEEQLVWAYEWSFNYPNIK